MFERATAQLTSLRPGVFIPLWVVCGLIAAVLISVMDHSNQVFYSRLIERGVVVDARVTRTEPSEHDTVYYSFPADGKTFESASPADSPNPEASQLKSGDRLRVVYDARDPHASCACDPRQLAAPSAWWRRLIAGLFLGSIVAVVLAMSLQRRLEVRRSARDRGATLA